MSTSPSPLETWNVLLLVNAAVSNSHGAPRLATSFVPRPVPTQMCSSEYLPMSMSATRRMPSGDVATTCGSYAKILNPWIRPAPANDRAATPTRANRTNGVARWTAEFRTGNNTIEMSAARTNRMPMPVSRLPK